MKEKILCVIRASTLQQELDSQRIEMERFCVGLGFSSANIVWLESQGASARSLNEKYLQLLDSIKEKVLSGIENVAVFHLNRLGRKEEKLNELKTFFIKNKVQLYIKNPSVTLLNSDRTVNTMSSMFYSMLAVSIEVDTEELMAKTLRGKKHNTELGKFNGGAYGALFGYRVKSDGYIEIDPEESKLVSDIFQQYSTGMFSFSSLALELRQRGITHRGRKMTDQFIKSILTREDYKGGNPRYEPIITEDIFNRCKDISTSKRSVPNETKRIYMALKILKCRHCGYNYTAGSKTYQCYKKVKGGRYEDPCRDSEVISIEVMDNILLYLAKLYHIDYLSRPDVDAISEAEAEKERLTQKLNEAERNRVKIKSSMERLQEMYVEGDLDRERYNVKVSTMKERQKALNEARGAYMVQILQQSMLLDSLRHPSAESFIDIWNNVDEETNRIKLRDIVRMHIKEATIRKDICEGRKCMKVTVTPYRGNSSEFVYFYTLTKQDVYIYANGKLSKVW